MSWTFAAAVACRALAGTVFTVSVVSKIRGPAAWQAFRDWLGQLPVLPLRAASAPFLLTGAEAAVAVLVAIPAVATAGLFVAAALCLALTAGLAIVVRQGSAEPCQCFGASAKPPGWGQVGRNATLFAIATAGAVCSLAAGSGGGRAAAQQVALAVVAGLAGALLVIFADDIVGVAVAVARPADVS